MRFFFLFRLMAVLGAASVIAGSCAKEKSHVARHKSRIEGTWTWGLVTYRWGGGPPDTSVQGDTVFAIRMIKNSLAVVGKDTLEYTLGADESALRFYRHSPYGNSFKSLDYDVSSDSLTLTIYSAGGGGGFASRYWRK